MRRSEPNNATSLILLAAIATSDGKKDEQPVPDEDPLGEKLLTTETPLEDALKLWQPLEKMASRRVDVWTKGYEIYIRRSALFITFYGESADPA